MDRIDCVPKKNLLLISLKGFPFMKEQLLQIQTDYNNTPQVEAKQQVISSLKIVIFCALRAPHLGFCCRFNERVTIPTFFDHC